MLRAANLNVEPIALPASVPQFISDHLVVTRTSAAAFGVMLFDICIALDVEIECIWRRNWSLTKVLYILCRYLGLLNGLLEFLVQASRQPSMQICKIWSWYGILGVTLASSIPCNALLAMRLHALFRDIKYIRIILIVLYIVENIVVAALLVITRNSSAPVPQTHMLPSCPPSAGHAFPPFVTTIPNFVLILLYFCLAIYKVIQHMGERGLLRGLMTEGDNHKMVSVFSFLLRDTVLFYFATLGVVLVNFIYSALFPNRFISYAAVPFLIAAYSLTGSRLILFLRGEVNNKTGVYKAGTEHRIDKTVDYEMMAMMSHGWLDEDKSDRGLVTLPILESGLDQR